MSFTNSFEQTFAYFKCLFVSEPLFVLVVKPKWVKFIKSLLVYKAFFLLKWKAPFPFNLKIFQLHPWKFYEIYQVRCNTYGDWGWSGAFTNWQFHSSNTSKYPTSNILETLTIRLLKVYINRATWTTFQPKLEKLKNKKMSLWKNFSKFLKKNVFLIFWETELSSLKIKSFQDGIFQAQKMKQTRSENFFCNSGNGSP